MRCTALAIALIAGGTTLSAKDLSAEDAMAVAANFRSNEGMRFAPADVKMSIAYSGLTDSGVAYYAVNYGKNEGFALVSGDDRAPEVLGYSTTGEFPAGELPLNVKWWLAEYARQIDYIREHATGTYNVKAQANRQNIPQLLHVAWDQDAPYNNLCPTVRGGRAVTGCVATAMAQVMKYYNWPVKSEGQCTYNGRTVTLNTTFDWDNMLDTYMSGKYTTAQGTAVAQLMFDCGRSVDMEYSSSASGAYTDYIPGAFYRNFGYDKSIAYSIREYYSDTEWDDMMYAELAAGRPIVYGGNTRSQEGHQFIADGYENGYYHINWGWSGAYDGYFLLDALDPDGQGIGGGSSAFNYDQDAVYRIMKPCGGSIQIEVVGPGNFANTKSGQDYFGITNTTMQGVNGFINLTGSDFTVMLGVKVVDVNDSSKVKYYEEGSNVPFVCWDTVVDGFGLNMSDLADGIYIVSPMVKSTEGEWYPIRMPADMVNALKLTVSNGKHTYSKADVDPVGPDDPTVKVEKITLDATSLKIAPGASYQLTATVMPEDATDKTLKWESMNEAKATVDNNGLVTGVATGTAMIRVSSTDGSNLSATCVVDVNPKYGENDDPIAVESIVLGNTKISLKEGEGFQLDATVIPTNATDKSLEWRSGNDAVATVNNTGYVTGISVGTTIVIVSALDGSDVQASCLVTVLENESGVDSIDANVCGSVYNAQGLLLMREATVDDLKKLPAGLYIFYGKKVIVR